MRETGPTATATMQIKADWSVLPAAIPSHRQGGGRSTGTSRAGKWGRAVCRRTALVTFRSFPWSSNHLQHLCGEQHKARLTCHPFSFCWDPSKQKPNKNELRRSVCSVLVGWFNKSHCFLIKQCQRCTPELSAVTFFPSLCPKTAAIIKKGFSKQQANPWFFKQANEYFLGLNQSLEIIVKFTVVFLPHSVLYSWQTWCSKEE